MKIFFTEKLHTSHGRSRIVCPRAIFTCFGPHAHRPHFSSFATSERLNLNVHKTTSAITPDLSLCSECSGSTAFRASSIQDNPGPGTYCIQTHHHLQVISESTKGPQLCTSGQTVGASNSAATAELRLQLCFVTKINHERDVWEENNKLIELPGPGHYDTETTPTFWVSDGQRPRIGARRSRQQRLDTVLEFYPRYLFSLKTSLISLKDEGIRSTTGRTDVMSHISTPFRNPTNASTPGPGMYIADRTYAHQTN
ncbi:hypothetical protein Plhal703r1_c80g0173641 [Plasmopara halstedii]